VHHLRQARSVDDATSGARFVERRSSSVVARRHPSFRPAAGTIASRPLEQGSPWIVRLLRAIHDARETMSATEVASSTVRADSNATLHRALPVIMTSAP
jgi:hypothetical protein